MSSDLVLRGEDRAVARDLIVEAPATLRLEGTVLRIGRNIWVQEGAHLEVHPWQSTPSVLRSLDDGPASSERGFSMTVDGTWLTQGLPATQVHGIRGTGLHDFFAQANGININGRAELTDLHLRDSNGTLFVRPAGWARLERSTVERMGFLGLGALGNLEIANSTLRSSTNGVMGHAPCTMQVTDTRIEAELNVLLSNSCPLEVARSQLIGGVNGIYASGNAHVRATDTEVRDYTHNGIFGHAFPGDNGSRKSPRLELRDVTVDPRGHQVGISNGITLEGTSLTMRNSTVRGNTGSGILAKDASLMEVRDSRIHANADLGILGSGALLAHDLLTAGNDFGSEGSGQENGKGALRVVVLVYGVIVDADGHGVGGTLEVFRKGSGIPIARHQAADGVALLQAGVDAYGLDFHGHPVFQGPFTYRLTHGSMDHPQEGALDLADPLVHGHAASVVEAAGTSWDVIGLGVGLGASAAMVALGVFWRPATHVWRRLFRRARA